MPPQRRVQRRVSDGCPQYHVFYDCETSQSAPKFKGDTPTQSFRLGHAVFLRLTAAGVSSRSEFPFTDPDCFWDWLTTKARGKSSVWVWAHNAEFDAGLIGLFPRLTDGRLYLWDKTSREHKLTRERCGRRGKFRGSIVLSPSTFLVKCRLGATTLTFVDSMNYSKAQLSDIGDRVGLSKLEWPGFDSDHDTLATYCARDVHILERFAVGLMSEWRESKAGRFRPTAPMLAMASYQRIPNGANVVLHGDERTKAIERAACFGGRTDCFYYGRIDPPTGPQVPLSPKGVRSQTLPIRGPVHLIDVRSLYPWVMYYHHMPARWIKTVQNPTIQSVRSNLEGFMGIARVTIEELKYQYPYRRDNDTAYVVGRYVTTLADAELRQAVYAGHVVKVHEIAYYVAARHLRNWVEFWWGKRIKAIRAGDDVGSEMAKLILNSLTGKWAQRTPAWTDVPGMIPPTDYGQWLYSAAPGEPPVWFRSIAGAVQRMDGSVEHPAAFPAVYACITSAGRLRMDELRFVAGDRQTLYQATDGLLVTDLGLERIRAGGYLSPDELGGVRVELSGDSGEIAGCHNLTVGSYGRLSGVPSRATPVGPCEFEYDSIEARESIMLDGGESGYKVRRRRVSRTRRFLKGSIGRDGWVTPWRLTGTGKPPWEEVEELLSRKRSNRDR